MAQYYDVQGIAEPRLRDLLEQIMDITNGHSHDGTDSKAVTTGTPAAGALSADAGGRAIMEADFFNEATVLDKFATDSIDNAELLKIIKNGAFVADASTRALFADGIINLAKIADTAKTHIVSYQVEDLAAGIDITARPIFVVPTGFIATVTSAVMIPLGTSAGVDDLNNCIVGIGNGSDSIAYIAFDVDPGFPADGVVTSLGALDVTNKVLEAGDKLTVTITNGATANPPPMIIQVAYKLADA